MSYVNDTEQCSDWECMKCKHTGLVVTHRNEKQGDSPLHEYIECPKCKFGYWSYTITWSNGGE